MNYILNRLDQFFQIKKIDRTHILLSFLFVIYLVDYNLQYQYLKLPFILIAFFFMVLGQSRREKAVFWALSAVIFFADIFLNPTLIANHYFLFGYVSISMSFSFFLTEEKQMSFLKEQFLWLFVIVMFFSGVQKVISPEFMDGSALTFLFIRHELGGWLLDFFPQLNELAVQNQELVEEFSTLDPLENSSLVLNNVWSFFPKISPYISWIIAGLELGIGVFALFFFKKKWFHFLVVTFLVGIFFTRKECGFLLLLTIMTLHADDSFSPFFKRIYLLLAIVFSSAILVGLGYS